MDMPRERGSVTPERSGCWFCWNDDGEMYSTWEFDALFHMECLMYALSVSTEEARDEEAEIIGLEYGLR